MFPKVLAAAPVLLIVCARRCTCFTYVVPFNLKTTLYLDKLMAWMKLPARAFMYGQMKYWSVPIETDKVSFYCEQTQEDCQYQAGEGEQTTSSQPPKP